jgi:hypothetical protein
MDNNDGELILPGDDELPVYDGQTAEALAARSLPARKRILYPEVENLELLAIPGETCEVCQGAGKIRVKPDADSLRLQRVGCPVPECEKGRLPESHLLIGYIRAPHERVELHLHRDTFAQLIAGVHAASGIQISDNLDAELAKLTNDGRAG